MQTKQEIFLGEGTRVQSHRGREPRRTGLSWPAVSGLMVMGFISGLSLADHCDSESSQWCRPSSAQMDAREDSGRWSDMWVSPLDLSQTLPVGGGSLVPCSLPEPHVIKQLKAMVPRCLARVESVRFP